jgi:hypothetical protein
VSLEATVRDYLRSRPNLMALVNGDVKRVNMEWTGPSQASRVNLYRAGGGQNDYVPIETAAITFHCYGSTRPAASDLADAVAREMRAIHSTPGSPLLSASIESHGLSYTPDGVARYVVTTSVTAVVLGPIAA